MKKRIVAFILAVLLGLGVFILNSQKVQASQRDMGQVQFSTGSNTVLLSDGYYSSSSSLTPSPSTVDIGVDPASIQKVVIQDANGNQIAQLTQNSGSVYTLPSLSGNSISVNAKRLTSSSGYFRWLRNAHSNVWSFDDENGTNYTSDAGGPKDSYGYYTIPSQAYVWHSYHVIPHPSGFTVSGGTVPISAVTNVFLSNADFVFGSEPPQYLQLETGSNSSFVNGYDAKVAFTELFKYVPDDPSMSGHYADPSALWYQYHTGVQVDYYGTTYYYPNTWHIVAYVNDTKPDYIPNGMDAAKVILLLQPPLLTRY